MAAPITSTSNERVKWVRSLLDRRGRQSERHYLIEGVRLVEEALRARLRPELVLVDPEALRSTLRGAELYRRLRGLPQLEVSSKVLRSVADTVAPQGVVAAVPLPPADLAPGEDLGSLVLILGGLQDPGNVGTILRSAEAAGVRTVALTRGSVDVYAPKVVRAGMGAHFRLRLLPECDAALPLILAGRDVWLADAGGEVAHWDVDWLRPTALVIGNEARGLELSRFPAFARSTFIPIQGEAESLNAAMAASVIVFEAARQRAQCPRA